MQGIVYVDENAHRPKGRTLFRSDLAYGKVLKMFVHNFRNEEYELALVKLSPGFERGDYGFDSCSGKLPTGGGLYVMEASQLEGLVGTIYNSATNRTYIVDPTHVIDMPGYEAKRHVAA
jgi:hypothetical protein